MWLVGSSSSSTCGSWSKILPRPMRIFQPPEKAETGSAASADEVRRTFQLYDADASGDIDVGELRSALQALGLGTTTLEEAAQIMQRYDADSSRKLDINDFTTLVNELRRFQEQRRRV